jgi:thiol-disulfide isomerase/thioredoxin
MIERALVTVVLLVAGFSAYRLFTRYHIWRAAVGAVADPILSDLKPGVPAIVYFTTPTCAPCRTQQQPALTRLQTELGDNNVQIVRIDATENPDAADRWGVFSAPTTFVLDSQRQVREVNHGVADTLKLKRQIETAEMKAVKI